MSREELLELSDDELLKRANKMKSDSLMTALLIGICIGVIFWSVAKNTWGLFTLVPLFFIYKMVNKSESHQALKEVLKERNLK